MITIKSAFLYICGLLILSFTTAITAQDEIAHFQDFTIEDGLSSIKPTIFFQDSRGIIWIGTNYGINSYNGTSFKSYTKEVNGLCHDYIQNIAEDGKGNLWIQSGDFARKDYCYSILDPISELVFSIEEYTGQVCPFDPHHTKLFANYKGTFLIKEHREQDQIQFYEVMENKIVEGFSCIYKDTFSFNNENLKYPAEAIKINKEHYLFTAPKEPADEGYRHDLFELNGAGEITKHRPESLPWENLYFNYTDGQHFYYSYFDDFKITGQSVPFSFYKDGNFLARTDYILNKEIPPFLIKDKIYKFHPDRIEKYSPSKQGWVHDQSMPLKKKRGISAISFRDRGGNIWFYGLNEITKLSFLPNNFKLNFNNPHLDTDNSRPIRGIASKPDGTVFVGELKGLNIRNPNLKGPAKWRSYDSFTGGDLGLLYDDDKLWVGKEHTGLSLFNLKTKKKYHYGQGLIWQPYKSSDGTIWAGAGEGLFKLDTLQKDLIPFRNYGAYKQLQKSSIYAFHHNEKGTWLSSSSGVYLVDLDQEKIVAHYSDTQTGEFYIPANQIAHIHEDEEGVFWLATKGQGLIRWNTATGKSEQLTVKNTGLSHNVLSAVYEDDFGNLWLPSSYGLNCLNKASRQISIYLKDDGLPHNDFNTISHHQDKDGKLYFGTVNGMIEFHPRDFNHQGEQVPFMISKVLRIDRQTESSINMTRSVLDKHSLTVQPSDKSAEFNFALLEYKKTSGNQYSYKIKGYRDNWTYQTESAVEISGLPYGNYELLLRGKASGSNMWVDYPHPIKIHFAKPFYLKWWFILATLFAIVGTVFYLIKRNSEKLLKRQKELETVVEERTEEIRLQAEELKQLDKVKSNFFANISHELRTPLTLILGPLSFILDNSEAWEKEHIKKQLVVMQRNGKSLMQLIEEILDLSKLEANKLDLQEESTPLVQFFEYLFHVFEPQFQSQGLDYELILDLDQDLNILLDRKKMEKVLNNFLSNAIKFTPKNGKITLEVRETDSDIHIIVTDTGKGIHPKDIPYIFDRFYQSKQADQKLYGGTGIGLALVNEFAQLMGGKVHAESTLGKGSKFFFELPKKKVAKIEFLMPTLIDLPEEDIYSIGRDFTILVVEDNPDMRNFIYQLLVEKYSCVLLANNGVEGLETLKKHGTDINLIVSDVMMPVVDGLTMLKEIKNNQEWYDIPVIMLTALAAERDKLTALTIGVDDYLTKPFSVPELLIRVQNLLFNYHLRKEWQNSSEFKEHQEEIQDPNDSQIKINAKDKEWVDELRTLVEQSFGEGILNVDSLAKSVFISSRQLNRKLNAITGLSSGKFIREIQLQAARKELESGTAISIFEVAHNVGFDNQSSFSKVFKNRFGKTPSEYLKN